jgi:two-component system sensor histidine kinase/response regulator
MSPQSPLTPSAESRATRHAPLSRVLLWRVVGLSLLLTLCTTLLAAHFTRTQERARQRAQIDAVVAAHRDALAKAVWELDEPAVALHLSALKHFPALLASDLQGEGLHMAYQKPRSSMADAGDVLHVDLLAPDGHKSVATWALTYDARALSQEVWLQTARFLGLVMPQLLLMAWIVFVLVRRRVSEPVQLLTQHVRGLSLDSLNEALPEPDTFRSREVHQLGEGIGRLQHALAQQLDEREAVTRTLAAQKAQLNKLLAAQTQQLDELLSFTADGAGVLDASGTIVAANPAWTDMMGWVRHQWPGRAPVETWLAETDWPELLQRLGQASRLVACELLLRHVDGRTLPMEVSLSVMERDAEGVPCRIHIVLRDLSQRREVEQTLIDAREQALAATRTKSAFLANMSHEIRTPLNAVIGLTELALRTELSPTQRDLLSKSRQAAQTLLGIIHDILDFSKIEAGKLELVHQPFDLDDLLDDLIPLVALPARDKGLSFVLDVGAQVPRRVLGDALRLKQVLTNLCFNAVKFTQHGRVTLSIQAMPAGKEGFVQLQWVVQDTGPGMGATAQASLFQPFSQVDDSHSRRHGGTGLGLAISQQLVQAMGGRIQLDSEVGQGCRFTVMVVLSLDAEVAPAEPWLGDMTDTLLIEPMGSVAEPLARLLREAGAQVEVVSDIEAAMQWAQAQAVMGPVSPGELGIWIGPGWDDARARQLRQQMLPLLAKRFTRVCRLLPWGAAWVPQGAVAEDDQGEAKREAWMHWPGTSAGLRRAWMQAGDRGARGVHHAATARALAPRTESGSHIHMDVPPLALRGLRVLLVEDNALNQEVAAGMLELAGIDVHIVGDGQQALDKLAMLDVDAVLMDVQMPVMDGLTATRRIRNRPEWGRLPVVGMSANALARDREQALLAGMNAYLTKPIDPALMWHTLVRLCRPAAPAADRTEPVLDREAGLMVCARDPSLYARLARMFVQLHADAGVRQQAWCAQAQWDALGQHLHQLKADAGTLGALRLSQRAEEAEACCRLDAAQRPEAMRAHVQAMAIVLEATLEALAPVTQLAEGEAAEPAGGVSVL